MKVLLVTTWDTACGIAEHSYYLKAAVEAADPDIEITPSARHLDPNERAYDAYDLVHLNYHAALHSRWTPEWIRCVQQGFRRPVVVTYHDTGVPNSDQCKAVIAAGDAAVVHEPFDDLPAEKTHYWRMGVPDWQTYQFDTKRRPLLGTVGFPFPWKNYDTLAEVTAACGWDLLLLAPKATAKDEARWKRLNPRTSVCPTFLSRHMVVSWLAGCDATAFCYTCANTGQSGAILHGIAARKPVIAFEACRQFRALHTDPLGLETIIWCETFEEVATTLRHLTIARVDPGIVALAEQESWTKVGAKYAQLFRSLL